jgi:pantoate--beta-alanine ligase
MILFKKAETLSNYISQQKKAGKKIGFVPTMGALHQGHLSLIEASKKENAATICSIFVNPTQFNNAEDFKHYPVAIETDIAKLINAGCDVLFLPPKEEIYPPGFIPKKYTLGQLETVFEGEYRPGHFQGVCQVVDRLLEIVQPDNLYLGAKDYQQCKVITRLVSLLGKQDQIIIHVEPTYREKDGLAMSSRNLRLNMTQRRIAPSIFEVLSFIKENEKNLSPVILQQHGVELLTTKGFKVDYLQIADAETLLPPSEKTISKIALAAAYIDNIRLIDNLTLN